MMISQCYISGAVIGTLLLTIAIMLIATITCTVSSQHNSYINILVYETL